MLLLPILKYPDKRLNIKAEPIICFDEETRTIIADMAYTMYQSNGIGLAATQVNIHKKIIVIDISKDRNELMVLINPEITFFGDIKQSEEEGCLSIMDTYEKVERPYSIVCKINDEYGNTKVMEVDGLLARCIQHEIDHLNGKLFIEYLSVLKRDRILTRIKKSNRLNK